MLNPRSSLLAVLFPVIAMTLTGSPALSQSKTSTFSADGLKITVTDSDRSAAVGAALSGKHPSYAHNPVGVAARSRSGLSRQSSLASLTTAAGEIVGYDYSQNPGDVTYQGGPTVKYAASHAIYINPGGTCAIAGCWGDPESFLQDVSYSDFIHVLDQYVGLNSDRRYTVGFGAEYVGALPPGALSESDLLAIVHAVVAITGAGGYGNIYHLFLAPGIDTCFNAPNNNECYSPDNPSTFAFCAYHDSATFSDLGHVLFTVEPWQGPTSGCEDSPVGAPNSQLIDSTNDSLSHELFETISDPDGTAWWNNTNEPLLGNEMADECIFLDLKNYQIEPTFRVNGHLYRVQSEYSNRRHACGIVE